MPQYKDTVDDLVRKYSGSFVKLEGRIVQIQDIASNSEGLASVLFGDGDKWSVCRVLPDNVPVWEDLMPESQFFNFIKQPLNVHDMIKVRAMQFYLRGRRQWIRSVSNGNSIVTIPIHEYMRAYNIPGFDIRMFVSIIDSIYNGKFYPFEEAFDLVRRECAVAISPNFCLCIHPTKLGKALLKGLHGFVGEVDKTHISVFHDGSFQEVVDMRNRLHINAGIERCH